MCTYWVFTWTFGPMDSADLVLIFSIAGAATLFSTVFLVDECYDSDMLARTQLFLTCLHVQTSIHSCWSVSGMARHADIASFPWRAKSFLWPPYSYTHKPLFVARTTLMHWWILYWFQIASWIAGEIWNGVASHSDLGIDNTDNWCPIHSHKASCKRITFAAANLCLGNAVLVFRATIAGIDDELEEVEPTYGRRYFLHLL